MLSSLGRAARIRFAMGLAGALSLVVPLMVVSAGDRSVAVADTPAWTRVATVSGRTPATQPVTVSLWLAVRDEAGLANLARSVSTPGSASYGHYISADDFHQRFSPSAAAVDAIAMHLRLHHLAVTEIPDNRLYVTATGRAADVESAFAVHLMQYRLGSEERRAPQESATLPARLASLTVGVTGLSSGDQLARPDHVDGHAGFPAALNVGHPCSNFWGEVTANAQPPAFGHHLPYAVCGYAGSALRTAYGVDHAVAQGNDGSGQTVAIVDAYASPTMAADLTTYSGRHGLAALAGQQYSELLPRSFFPPALHGCQTPDDWSVEEALDVETVHTMAPGSRILYAAGRDCSDQSLLAAENSVIDKHLASIISNSWGGVGDIDQLPVSLQQAYTHTFLQAAAEGIGVFFSSGDAGDELVATGIRTVDFPASDPWITAVGGTSLGIDRQGQRLFETGWSTSRSDLLNGSWSPSAPGAWIYGAGGGTSTVFPQPPYQKGVVPGSIARFGAVAKPGRAVPDIAMDADPSTGFTLGQTVQFPDNSVRYAEGRIGGTSLACPMMAAMEALADQSSGKPHGFANPAIYRLVGTPALHDISAPPSPLAVVRADYVNAIDPTKGVVYSLRALGTPTSIWARPGYDDVTGVGTPQGATYITMLGR